MWQAGNYWRWVILSLHILRSINLPSVEFVEKMAFLNCTALTDVEFSNKVKGIDEGALGSCTCLELIAIPLKDG